MVVKSIVDKEIYLLEELYVYFPRVINNFIWILDNYKLLENNKPVKDFYSKTMDELAENDRLDWCVNYFTNYREVTETPVGKELSDFVLNTCESIKNKKPINIDEIISLFSTLFHSLNEE